LNIKFSFVAVFPVVLFPSKVRVPLAEVEPIKSGTVADVVNVGVVIVGEPANTNAPLVPVSSETEVIICEEVIEPLAVPYKVPEVGSVTEVAPPVAKVTVSVPEPTTVFPETVIVLPVLATPVPPY
jgi:hypothetical protein